MRNEASTENFREGSDLKEKNGVKLGQRKWEISSANRPKLEKISPCPV